MPLFPLVPVFLSSCSLFPLTLQHCELWIPVHQPSAANSSSNRSQESSFLLKEEDRQEEEDASFPIQPTAGRGRARGPDWAPLQPRSPDQNHEAPRRRPPKPPRYVRDRERRGNLFWVGWTWDQLAPGFG